MNANSSSTSSSSARVITALKQYAKDGMDAYERKWTVENRGQFTTDDELGATQVLGCDDSTSIPGPYYVSTIISGNDGAFLGKLFQLLPFEGAGVPPVLGDSKHDGGCWLFIGSNPHPDDKVSSNCTKRKRDDGPKPLVGRAEHVDEVEHSGTWHVQLAGSKTWLLRPDLTADWGDADAPDISDSQHHEVSDKNAKRLRIQVEEGDLFILNTRQWYHRTQLNVSSEMSISLARDFFLPAEALFAESSVKEGEIILEEDALPDAIPSSNNPNCALAEVEAEESDEECSIVLVALRDISAGEELTISSKTCGGEAESIGGDDQCNAPDAVDPRLIAAYCARKGDILLRNEEIPEELVCSPDDPSCAIAEDGDDIVLKALRNIVEGEVLSVPPQDGVEYEEINVDTATGELVNED